MTASPRPASELAPVRADEVFDPASLVAYLRGNLAAAGAPEPMNDEVEVLQFPGGHSNLTYLVRLGGNEYVVRRPPLGPVAPKAHDMGREFKVLSRLSKVFSQAPRAYLYCEDASVIGAPFLVMERREGIVIRNAWPEELPDDPALRRRISESTISTLAALHMVDYEAVGLGDFGRPDGFVGRQVTGWAERWERAKTREIPAVDEIVAWLKDRLPEPQRASLIHNDYKFDNIMLSREHPDQITSIFDWEMSTLGDPLIDLGITLAYWVHLQLPGKDGRRLNPAATPGFFSRDEILEHYGRATGLDMSRIAYYEAFALFKNAVVLEQIYVRFVKGQTKDQRFSMLGMVVEPLVKLALDLANKSGL